MENIRRRIIEYHRQFDTIKAAGEMPTDEIFNLEDEILSHFGLGSGSMYLYQSTLQLKIAELKEMPDEIVANTIIEYLSALKGQDDGAIIFQGFEIYEIVFSKNSFFTFNITHSESLITANDDVVDEELHSVLLMDDFGMVKKLLKNAGAKGFYVIDKIQQHLNSNYDQAPFVINVERDFGQTLSVNNILVKAERENNVNEQSNTIAEFRVISIHPKSEKLENAFEAIDRRISEEVLNDKLGKCHETLVQSYMLFLQFQEMGFVDIECRARAGLSDNLLFQMAFLLYKMRHIEISTDFITLHEYVFEKKDFDLLETNFIRILTGFKESWFQIESNHFDKRYFISGVHTYLARNNYFIPVEIIDKTIDLLFEYLREKHLWWND
ncbi:MAG: hypothetical protein WCM76_14770 [Bacteroidota bacterium]